MAKRLPDRLRKLELQAKTLRKLTIADDQLAGVAGGTYSRSRPTVKKAPTQDCH